ncbi:MAG TPA: DUF542 domain-containing protein [Thermoanaerobaculia bacterium]|nr:DUF542 domain-containing protein [Thermoanaerobaculia bacterium]
MAKQIFTRDTTLADATRVMPEAVTIFEDMGIDYSCQGLRSLADAAHDAGYHVEELLARLDGARTTQRQINWFKEPLPALIDFLTGDHRRTLGEHLPELRNRIDQVTASVGEISELRRIRVLFTYLADALSSHVFNEERELFPFINHLDAANHDLLGAPNMRISQRVLRELLEHESHRDRLRTLRELAQRLPADESVSAFRNDLNAFAEEINRHMHLENNILYPRAIEIENGLRRNAAASF